MAIHLRHLRYFVKIVEAGSFSRAATLIYVAQPALSQQIAELEEELGVTLLHRSARGVHPTQAGEALLTEARSILRQVERLPDVVRSPDDAARGPVSLGMSSTLASVLSGSFMQACRSALPEVELTLIAEDSATLRERVVAQTLDLALVFDEEAGAALLRRPLFRQRLYLIDRKGSSRRRTKSLSLAQMGQLPLVLAAPPNQTRTLLDRAFEAAGVVPTVVAQSNLLPGMLSAVHAGVGATVLPLGDLSHLPGGAEATVTAIEPPIYQTAQIVSSSALSLSRAGEAVQALLMRFIERYHDEGAPPGMARIEKE